LTVGVRGRPLQGRARTERFGSRIRGMRQLHGWVRQVVYAIVRAGGRQEKVQVGDVVTLDRIAAGEDGTVRLAPLLLVDGDTVTHEAAKLADVTVTAEVLGDLRGKKIVIQKFKNKTGYKKRQGHRQELTRVRVTAIG
jgi:large subunit ribosomal protein L21